ncbi:hypothetical protein [Streptomyces silvisoli]|uniref:Uncharacterized protein n=1 Tax=Streptomyces silvisoli TaxID=3034235 RepID=A0ABT5ZP42_9ACTN|nr:hypothetical protein [Streptomyces silvisoli]MDF3291603.1 hypothetical protein [Streptomyces silvisoli]
MTVGDLTSHHIGSLYPDVQRYKLCLVAAVLILVTAVVLYP